MKLFNKNTLYITLFILIIILLSINSNTYEHLTESKKEEAICPGPIELPCNPGPQGDRGPAGGEFQAKGPLRNLDKINLVSDRTDNIGSYITSFLNERTYKPEQTWTLTSGTNDLPNRIQNQSGNCLTVDDKDNVEINNCTNAKEWVYTSQGLLQPKLKGKDKKCLTYTNAGLLKNLEKASKIGSTKSKKIEGDRSIYRLNLAACGDSSNPPLNQQWSFN